MRRIRKSTSDRESTASIAASMDCRLSQTITPGRSAGVSSLIKTGTPPTSSTMARRSAAVAAMTVAGTGTPLAARSCRDRILLRLEAMAAASFSVGTPIIPK